MKNIWRIFLRDLKTARRDSMALLIIVMPIILAVGIVLFTPGLNDTTVNLVLLSTDSPAHIEYMENFAKVELVPTKEKAINRVTKRDDVVALINNGEQYEIILQGNESEIVEKYATSLVTLYELGSTIDETTATIYSFEHTVPPVKTSLVNFLIAIMIMLAGMLIAISIVNEKSDNTINAINVTPVSQTEFILGKVLMGGLIALTSIVVALFITGYYHINWFMIVLVGLSSMILSLIVGFIQGLTSKDAMEAASSVKMIFLPVAGSIAVYEFVAPTWHWTVYWSPFYWSYKANQLILSNTADWQTVLFCTGMVLVLSLAVYFVVKPKIREGLS